MVTVLIFSIVVIIFGSLFVNSDRLFNFVQGTGEAQRQVRLVARTLNQELRNVTELSFDDSSGNSGRVWFDGDDGLVRVERGSDPDSAFDGIGDISFKFETCDDNDVIERLKIEIESADNDYEIDFEIKLNNEPDYGGDPTGNEIYYRLP